MSIDGKGSYDVGGGAVPNDKFRLIYLIFGWLGIGTLLPWNMFITVSAYWDDKWKTVEGVDTGTLTNTNETLGKYPYNKFLHVVIFLIFSYNLHS